MKRFAQLILLIINIMIAALPPLFAQSGTADGPLPENVTFWSDYTADILARTIVERMSDEERLSQIFMFG